MSERLLYSVQAFVRHGALAEFYSDYGQHDSGAEYESDAWWGSQAVLVAYFVYARQLDEFLYPELKQFRETAEIQRVRLGRESFDSFSLVSDPQTWLDARPPYPEEMGIARKRINRTVMHLSSGSLSPSVGGDHKTHSLKQYWTTGPIWNHTKEVLKALRPCLNPGGLCQGFLFKLDRALDRGIDEVEDVNSLTLRSFMDLDVPTHHADELLNRAGRGEPLHPIPIDDSLRSVLLDRNLPGPRPLPPLVL
jgi:hypothetical protein